MQSKVAGRKHFFLYEKIIFHFLFHFIPLQKKKEKKIMRREKKSEKFILGKIHHIYTGSIVASINDVTLKFNYLTPPLY